MIASVEVASIAILVFHWWLGERPLRKRLLESLAIAAGAFLGEEICIRWEHAYQYSPGWHCWIDRVPLAVLAIWPSVVLSARGLARRWRPAPLPLALFTGALVWLDASLVEPIAAHVGLWTWNLAGPFHVAWVGPFGWGAYAFAISALLALPGWRLASPLLAPAVAQALLLSAHWDLARWLPAPNTLASLAVGLTGAGFATAWVLSQRNVFRLRWSEAAPRVAAAGLFFALLASCPDTALVILAAGVATPYLLLLPPRVGPLLRRPGAVSPATG